MASSVYHTCRHGGEWLWQPRLHQWEQSSETGSPGVGWGWPLGQLLRDSEEGGLCQPHLGEQRPVGRFRKASDSGRFREASGRFR